MRFDPAGYWWSTIKPEEWDVDEEQAREILSKYEGEYGDRRQELVFIGTEMDEMRIRAVLDECLLQDPEWLQGPDVWSEYSDPFKVDDDIEEASSEMDDDSGTESHPLNQQNPLQAESETSLP